MTSYTHIVFDLDETLYPRGSGLFEEMAGRIEAWVERALHLPPEEAQALRRAYIQRYGTTLGGLIAEQQVDVEDYLAFVHDVPVEALLRPDPALAQMLAAIPLHRVVFTNGVAEYGWRVLRALGVDRQFERIVGIREVGLCNKPRLEAYQRMLTLVGADGPASIMVDDRAVNLPPAKQLGMTTVLVAGDPGAGVDFVVADVLEVGALVAELCK